MNLSALATEGLGDAIADSAGATDDQHGLAGEIEGIGETVWHGTGGVMLGHDGSCLG
ncbi:hypothetical protein D9M72_635890 [compost metagenome]